MNFIIKCALGVMLLSGIQNANAQADDNTTVKRKLMTIDEQVVNAENIEPIALEKLGDLYYRHPFTEVRYKQKNTKNDYKIFFATAQDDQFFCRLMHVQNETDKQNRALASVDGNDMAEVDKQVCYRLRKTMQEFKHNNPVLHDSSRCYWSYPAFGGKDEFKHYIEIESWFGLRHHSYFYGSYSSKKLEEFVKKVESEHVTTQFYGLIAYNLAISTSFLIGLCAKN